MKKKDVLLYNVFFPLWMLMSLPVTWLWVIPGNFIVDSLVMVIAMAVLKMENRLCFYKKHILQVFGFGFLADILAAIPMWCLALLGLGGPLCDSPLLTVPGLVLGGVLIYVFNYFITFRQCEQGLRRRLSLTFAIATAPYTYLIPSDWLYGF